jgi:homoserine kinase type II
MSVYTSLTLADVQPFLAEHGLPAATMLLPIKGGIENSNFFLHFADGREYVLTLFEELSTPEAVFLGPLLAHLDAAGLPVAAPLPDNHGRRLGQLAGKPAQLAPRLPGRHPEHPGHAQCTAMGAALAHLHLALRDYPLHRPNAHGASWWEAVAARWRGRLDAADRALLDRALACYAQACAAYPDLPRGLIHGDLFRDNTLFLGDRISGVLDFSECSHDHWLLDIAITANDFCRQWPGGAPDPLRRQAFLGGYEGVRRLDAGEHAALPAFLAAAALRFWLSRLDIGLRNREQGRSGEHVLEKDPQEMRELVRQLLA